MEYTKHDPKITSVFEVVSAYFIDTIYNHIYHSANVNLTGDSSLTDEYIRHMQAYVVGVKNDAQCYRDVTVGVHKYFMSTTRFTTLSFTDFVDKVVGVCVPSQYFNIFTIQDKDEMLSSILCDLITNLAVYATNADMLRRIIDKHTVNTDITIRMMQDTAVQILFTKRSDIHNGFLKKIGQARDVVSVDVVEDMKKALRRVILEKTDIESKFNTLNDKYNNAILDHKQREAKFRNIINLLKNAQANGIVSAGNSINMPKQERIAEYNIFENNKHNSHRVNELNHGSTGKENKRNSRLDKRENQQQNELERQKQNELERHKQNELERQKQNELERHKQNELERQKQNEQAELDQQRQDQQRQDQQRQDQQRQDQQRQDQQRQDQQRQDQQRQDQQRQDQQEELQIQEDFSDSGSESEHVNSKHSTNMLSSILNNSDSE